jgi:hypothetical protein
LTLWSIMVIMFVDQPDFAQFSVCFIRFCQLLWLNFNSKLHDKHITTQHSTIKYNTSRQHSLATTNCGLEAKSKIALKQLLQSSIIWYCFISTWDQELEVAFKNSILEFRGHYATKICNIHTTKNEWILDNVSDGDKSWSGRRSNKVE